MQYNLENGLENLINQFKKKETKYFDERIDQIEKNTLRLFKKTFDHSLNIDQLTPLRRHLQQAIAIYEFAIKNDKFQFIAIPHLKERLTEKLTGAIDDLKNALTIVETKLNDKGHKEKKIKTQKSKKQPPQTLLEIWAKDKKLHYNEVIKYLKEFSPTINCSFIIDTAGKLQWQRFDKHITYLAAFTKECIIKGYIENKYSAPDYKRVYSNTFNIEFNSKPFQAIVSKDFDSYSDPFKNMP